MCLSGTLGFPAVLEVHFLVIYTVESTSTVSHKSGRMWKKAVVARFKIVSLFWGKRENPWKNSVRKVLQAKNTTRDLPNKNKQ
jgi:hypothetical protein